MRVLLHEWCCSGGLAASGPAVPFTETLVAEGTAMLRALVDDAATAPDLSIDLLLDDRLADGLLATLPGAPSMRVIRVPAGEERETLARSSVAADWTLIVAPETDGLLRQRVALARRAGARVVASTDGFLATAADKQATAVALASRGVPVPAGRLLRAGEPLPDAFIRPAVAKARASCGGDRLLVVPPGAGMAPCVEDLRVEAWADGLPVGVSLLCGHATRIVLPPVRQRFSGGPSPRFLGGDLLLPTALADRARTLALRAVGAIESRDGAALGWIGVDMILGPGEDGGGDRVLEVNPRVTTSFVGLSRLGGGSLLRAMVALAAGDRPAWPDRVPAGDGAFTALD